MVKRQSTRHLLREFVHGSRQKKYNHYVYAYEQKRILPDDAMGVVAAPKASTMA